MTGRDVADEIARYWDRQSAGFDARASHVRHWGEWRKVLAAALPPAPAKVLDLGTGTGACALIAASLGHAVTGIDLSEGMLAQARAAATERGLAATFARGDLLSPPVAPGSQDAVTLRNVLWTSPDPTAVAATAHRCLKPGGTLLVSDGTWNPGPIYADAIRAQMPDYAGLTAERAKVLARAAGFSDFRRHEQLFGIDPYVREGDVTFFVLTARR